MIRVHRVPTLGIALAMLLPAVGDAQMVGRSSGRPARMGGEMRAPSAPRQSSLAPIRMGSVQPRVITSLRGGGRPYVYRPSFGIGRPISGCYGWCGGGYPGRNHVYHYDIIERVAYVYPYAVYAYPYYWYGYPIVYTTSWSPNPAKVWSPTSVPDTSTAAAQPADPAKSRMLTIGAGADGGGGVMRIETVSDSVTRVTWVGSTRPIREARLFFADSLQQSLRGALVDVDTPSALLKTTDLAPRIRYVGLTITHATGAIETTLIPYDPRAPRQP